jgi:hypothetical protein
MRAMPRAATANPSALRAPTPRSPAAAGRMRLLVIEDDDIVADAITRGLSAANYSVLRVASAEASSTSAA